MLASSFLDPVLGLDIHFEMVPTPAPVPLPIPNPFIGLVFDPVGLACGIAMGAAIGAVMGAPFQGPVLYWTAFPATNTGTEAKHVPGHILIPPGTAWAPFPKTPKPVIHPGETPTPALPVKPENDAVVVFGSKTVTVMGSNAVRLGDIALSCSEPLRLPSSVVLAVPKGAPILIGGPMSLDIMAAVMASLRTRFVSDSLHSLVSRLKPSRFRNCLHRVVCFFTGHPVDVASGKVMTESVDIELPGPLPLKVERIYSSAFAARSGPLGHGWSLSLDQAVWRERGKVVLLSEDGREIEFDTFDFPGHRIEAGQRVYNPIERLTLHCDGGETWRVVDHDGVVRHFGLVPGRDDGRAMIHKIVSRCGYHEISFHYAADAKNRGSMRGRLEWVRDSGGRFLRLVHDARGRVTELHAPKPQGEGFYRHRQYAYDAAGDLVVVTDSLGHAWRFAYATHLLTAETDRNGLSFYFQYDGLGQDAWCVRTWGDGGIYDHELAYDKQQHITYVTDSLGYTTQYHKNVVGQVIKKVDALGGETTFEYDPVTLRKVKEVDPLGKETNTRYDDNGDIVEYAAPGRGVWSCVRGHYGNPTEATDGVGGRWKWTYDRAGRLVERVDPVGLHQRCEHAQGMLRRVVSPGRETVLEYDGHKNLVRTRSSQGTLTLEHDGLGRVVSTTASPGGFKRTLQRDLEGNVITSSTSGGTIKRFRYDAEGWIVEAAEPGRRSTFEYSGLQRLTRRTTGDQVFTMGYDPEGRLVSVDKGNGELHELKLDPTGSLIEERTFDGRVLRYVRDAARRVVEVKYPSGRSTKVEHDAAGRVVGLRHDDGTFQEYEYRADGTLVRADNESMSVEIERDARGRVLAERVGDSWVASVYQSDGALLRRTTSQGMVESLSYDLAQRKKSMSVLVQPDPSRGLVDSHARWDAVMHYDGEGQELRRSVLGNLEFSWARDPQGRPRRWVAQRGGQTGSTGALERRYGWGPAGKLSASSIVSWHDGKESVEQSRRYSYDSSGRLSEVSDADGGVKRRLFDSAGNIHRGSGLDEREYSLGGRLLRSDDVFNEYDDDGRLVERRSGDGTTRYRWDGSGMLREVELPTGARVELVYDAMGRRHVKRVFDADSDEPQRELAWQWSGHVPLHESSEAELKTWVYDSRDLGPLAQLSGERAFSLATDALGTPTEMFDASGGLLWRRTADMDGEVGAEPASQECPLRWPGQYHDPETGLHYNRWRYYDPASSGYISPDPMGLLGGYRPYGYPYDPLTHADPFGLIDPWDIQFSQDSIGDTFLHGPWAGESLESAIEATRAAGRLPDGLELNVMSLNDQWVTLNNRTLYVVQQANLPQVHPNDLGPRGMNQLNKLLDGGAPLPLGEQPEVRRSCS